MLFDDGEGQNVPTTKVKNHESIANTKQVEPSFQGELLRRTITDEKI